MEGKITSYEEAARSIKLNLKDFCDEGLPYSEMIADAAREAAKEIERLRGIVERFDAFINENDETLPLIFLVRWDHLKEQLTNPPKS